MKELGIISKSNTIYILLLVTKETDTKYIETKGFYNLTQAMNFKRENLDKYDEILLFPTEME